MQHQRQEVAAEVVDLTLAIKLKELLDPEVVEHLESQGVE